LRIPDGWSRRRPAIADHEFLPGRTHLGRSSSSRGYRAFGAALAFGVLGP
jgi:hypothetical protein